MLTLFANLDIMHKRIYEYVFTIGMHCIVLYYNLHVKVVRLSTTGT